MIRRTVKTKSVKKTPRTKKYFAPQTEDTQRKCDHEGCDKAGIYRAPKDKKLKDYYWFCLDHVQEYNAQWNYYAEGEEDEDMKREKAKMHFNGGKSKIHYHRGYRFKDAFGFFSEYAEEFSEAAPETFFTEEERRWIKTMELDFDNLSLENLKKQYKKLVKKYHPDVNQGDKEAEEKFKQLTNAYSALLAKLS